MTGGEARYFDERTRIEQGHTKYRDKLRAEGKLDRLAGLLEAILVGEFGADEEFAAALRFRQVELSWQLVGQHAPQFSDGRLRLKADEHLCAAAEIEAIGGSFDSQRPDAEGDGEDREAEDEKRSEGARTNDGTLRWSRLKCPRPPRGLMFHASRP